MAETYPYKFYSSNGDLSILPSTNTPYGYQELDFAGALNTQLSKYQSNLSQYESMKDRMQNYSGAVSETTANITKYQDLINRYGSGGLTDTDYQFLSGVYGGVLTPEQLKQMAGGTQVASPFSNWNGAITETSKIPELEAQGATVDAQGNVVGAPLQTPTPLTSLPGQQYTDPNASGATYTPPGTGNANNTVYKDLQGNIFKMDGTPIDQDTFQKMGLNVSQINTKQAIDSRTGGQQEADTNYSAGGMTTGKLPGEQTDFMKAMTDRLSKIDSLVADIVASVQPSAEEKGVSESLNKMTESFELGMVDIEGQTIPMKAIIGQQAQLERRAGVKIKALQNKLKLLGEDREAKGKALEVAYNASRQGVSDAIKLYEMTQPDRIAFDAKTGTVFFQNPMTGEVYQEKIPGFVPSSDPTALEEEYNLMKKSGYTGSLLDYVQFKATQFGTEKSGTTSDEEKKLAERDASFEKYITTLVQDVREGKYGEEVDREQLKRTLMTLYPDYDENVIYDLFADQK